MLAGYLPFDDDPANPEGDNINLLYKYIVSTPLTFPEYVTPHARDLLKRILVPDPRKRADLFEVARHSWLSEYAHVVEFITSSTTTHTDIANTALNTGTFIYRDNFPHVEREILTYTEDSFENGPGLARSASVREPSKSTQGPPTVGGLQKSQAGVDDRENDRAKGRDTKRRTVQVEYVAPQSSTARGEPAVDGQAAASRTRARPEHQGPVEVTPTDGAPPARGQQRQAVQASMPPPSRPQRDAIRAASDSTAFAPAPAQANTTASRPTTGGSMTGGNRLPSRGNSYSQPATATVAPTNAQGRFSQPKGKPYTISSPTQQQGPFEPQSAGVDSPDFGRLSTQRLPNNHQQETPDPRYNPANRTHKRSSTLSGITDKLLGRSGSVKAEKNDRPETGDGRRAEKPGKSYPPTSMKRPAAADEGRRGSTDSRRTSFSFSRKNTGDSNGTYPKEKRNSRRFSLLKWGGAKKDDAPDSPMFGNDQGSRRASVQRQQMQSQGRSASSSRGGQQAPRPGMAFGQGTSRSPSQSTTATQSTIPVLYDSALDRRRGLPPAQQAEQQQPQDLQYAGQYDSNDYYRTNTASPGGGPPAPPQGDAQYDKPLPFTPQYPSGFDTDAFEPVSAGGHSGRNVLQKPHRRFNDAYENEAGRGHGHAESSGAAKKVADWFRRRGRSREG